MRNFGPGFSPLEVSVICSTRRIIAVVALPLLTGVGTTVFAQADPVPAALDPIVVTATRSAERAFDVPASMDIIEGSVIRDGQPMINLSESLARVPGMFAANRRNYAQDLQIRSRGFGARAKFGVRGVRLYQDGIPATMPDGQGQTGSFSLFSAQRIEVLRGPFSTLYGNASGGVISVFTEDGRADRRLRRCKSAAAATTHGTRREAAGRDGERRLRRRGNAFRDRRLPRTQRRHAAISSTPSCAFDLADATRADVIGNSLYQPEAQDPLGLTRAQWEAEPAAGRSGGHCCSTRARRSTSCKAALPSSSDCHADTLLHVTGYGGRAHGPAVPGAVRHRADIIGRGDGPRPRFRRRRCERHRGAPTSLGAPVELTVGGDARSAARAAARASSTTTGRLAICAATRTTRSSDMDGYAAGRMVAVVVPHAHRRRALQPGALQV